MSRTTTSVLRVKKDDGKGRADGQSNELLSFHVCHLATNRVFRAAAGREFIVPRGLDSCKLMKFRRG